jgi:hypothetical protein
LEALSVAGRLCLAVPAARFVAFWSEIEGGCSEEGDAHRSAEGWRGGKISHLDEFDIRSVAADFMLDRLDIGWDRGGHPIVVMTECDLPRKQHLYLRRYKAYQ